MRLNTFFFALVLSVGALLPAGAAVRLLELGHEAEPSMIRMPDRENGELTLTICPTCKVLRLRAAADTAYLIDNSPVTLKDMTKYLRSNPDANVVVMQLKDSAKLTRVVVHVWHGKK